MARFSRLTILLLAILLSACNPIRHRVYHIETFQQLATDWEQRLYDEFQREAAFYDIVDFSFNVAENSGEMAEQIAKAIQKGVDAIVVNPFEGDDILPYLNSAYDSGINVIYVGQKFDTQKYTSFVRTDNEEIGRMAAEYVCEQIPAGGEIIMLESFRDAPFYLERHDTFLKIIREHDIDIAASFDTGWDRETARTGMDSLAVALKGRTIDLIVAFHDGSIIGAYESEGFQNAKYVGMDGLPGDLLPLIKDGRVLASFTNPTGASRAIRNAVMSLYGISYEREDKILPKMVTAQNVPMYESSLESDEKYASKISALNSLCNDLIARLRKTEILLAVCSLLVLVLLVAIVLQHSWVKKNRKKLDDQTDKILSLEKDLASSKTYSEIAEQMIQKLASEKEQLMDVASESQVASEYDNLSASRETVFMNEFCRVVDKNISNPDLSVDSIALDLGVSRAQLFRRIKAKSGSTPNELVISIRLEKARDMLQNTDRTVSEIAYSVGFSSPSYFSKCYKDKFGVAPNECRP